MSITYWNGTLARSRGRGGNQKNIELEKISLTESKSFNGTRGRRNIINMR